MSRRTRIKICGVTTPDAARAAIDAGADAIGVVGAASSPRYLEHDAMLAIAAVATPFVTVVGVYVEPPADATLVGDWIQLHGNEDEARVAAVNRPVFRGFSFEPAQVRRWDRCPDVHALVIDGPAAGSGEAFDHTALAEMIPELRTPVILAGGLDADNVAAAISTVRPYAVDVSSGVESSPGVKDLKKIAAFCAAVRAADSG